MRKAQEALFEKGIKNGFTKSQMNALKRKDLTIKQLNDVFWMCRNIKDLPGNEAVRHVKKSSYKPEDARWFSAYALGRDMGYKEYRSLPDICRDNPHFMYFLNMMYVHTDMHICFPEFANEALMQCQQGCRYMLKYESANWIINVPGWNSDVRHSEEHRVFDKEFLFYVMNCHAEIFRMYEENTDLCIKYRDNEINTFREYMEKCKKTASDEELWDYYGRHIGELEKNGLNGHFSYRVPYVLMDDFGRVKYIEQCFRDGVSPEIVAESYYKKERLYETDDPDEWHFVRESGEYVDLCRVFPEEMKNKSVFLLDLAAWFPYSNSEVVTLDFDPVMASDFIEDRDLKELGGIAPDRDCYSHSNGGVKNRSYANNGYLTLRRKNGRRVTKFGYPVFGTAEELNSIIGFVVHFGTRERIISLLIPVNNSFTGPNEGASMTVHIMGAFNSGSKNDSPSSIDININGPVSERDGTLNVKWLSTNPRRDSGVEKLDCIKSAYDNIASVDRLLDLPVMDKREVFIIR